MSPLCDDCDILGVDLMMRKISKMYFDGFNTPLFISNVKYSNVNQFPVLFFSCVVIGWRAFPGPNRM